VLFILLVVQSFFASENNKNSTARVKTEKSR
jgi:hypothetical protein